MSRSTPSGFDDAPTSDATSSNAAASTNAPTSRNVGVSTNAAPSPNTGATEGRSVLVVDDEDAFRERLVRALRARGFEATGVASAEEAIRLAERETPECAVVDLRMPGRLSGLHAVRKLHELDPTTRIVVLTGYGSIATALDAVRSGAVHYLTKPADIDEIVAAFDHDGSPAHEPPPTSVPSLDRVEWEHIDRV
ncbi:MAG TPA: response regulator, partial [Polyangiaceae bacterium]|nr:response regulator [Polyangiaceae bacterium]